MKKMKKGFTIVELVIVIGVIAILSAVLIPTFTSLSKKAKEATAKQEVGDTYTAYVVYETDKGNDPLKQTEVVVERDGKKYTYTQGSGWAEDSDATKGAQKFDNGDNDGAADDGEIVIYALGA